MFHIAEEGLERTSYIIASGILAALGGFLPTESQLQYILALLGVLNLAIAIKISLYKFVQHIRGKKRKKTDDS